MKCDPEILKGNNLPSGLTKVAVDPALNDEI